MLQQVIWTNRNEHVAREEKYASQHTSRLFERRKGKKKVKETVLKVKNKCGLPGARYTIAAPPKPKAYYFCRGTRK